MLMRNSLLALCTAMIVAACGDSGSPGPDPTPTPTPGPTPTPLLCNGGSQLCDRAYDEVAYATTHNAYSNATDGFIGPNQEFAVPRQLSDGIRGLMLDAYILDGEVVQYHALADLGTYPLLSTLTEIREFLQANPREVVTIIFESYVDGDDIADVFAEAGLVEYAHAQSLEDPWPTLGEMIESGKRLVVFTDLDGGARDWYLPVWDFAFETPYSFSVPEDLSCEPNRGNPENSLFILNHFLTQTLGSPELAEQINFNPLLGSRIEECMLRNDRMANFVTVDFYNIGDTLVDVAALNE
ncbi:MAG: hypothetical protein P8K76_03680 [Candidatus Binatia bacterium]|nr:hypothetical protein [Candidatus Binatia bacterium]MDG1957562.1 hypothetical protein [Candidatus Binatia bacterium]MDG2008865.1 hypothetical protein [Candidatus Binatia bacterium]HAC79187.1 hypothetical protein [Deltaproteobacteria bacterium]